jgi:hypothetical protein
MLAVGTNREWMSAVAGVESCRAEPCNGVLWERLFYQSVGGDERENQ